MVWGVDRPQTAIFILLARKVFFFYWTYFLTSKFDWKIFLNRLKIEVSIWCRISCGWYDKYIKINNEKGQKNLKPPIFFSSRLNFARKKS